MDIKNVYAGIMTSDIKKACQWYEQLFDRKSDYHPMDVLYEWDFKEGGMLQLVEDKDRAGKSSITLLVNDIEAIKKSLMTMNISNVKISEGDIAKVIIIFDPENNRITFAENMQGR